MVDIFDAYAGQLVADGIDTTAPLIPFDNEGKPTDLRVLDGVMGKISKMIFKQPKVFRGPLDNIFIGGSMPYGSGSEIVSAVSGTPNAKETGTCIPRGQVPVTSQLNLTNFAYSVDLEIKDRVLAKYVNDASQLAGFVAMLMSTPQKTIGSLKWTCQKHIVSNVIDGTRSITSNTRSDASGTEVTYSANSIKGYAGKNETATYVAGTEMTIALAKEICDMVEDAYDQMVFETAEYNASGVTDYLAGTPNIIIESSVLRAMDRVLAGITDTHPSMDIPATTRLSSIGNVVKVDKFDVLPTNESYTGKTLGVVLADPELFRYDMMYEDVESDRCVKQRLTGYSHRGEGVMYTDRSAPAYAVLFNAVP